MLATKETFNVRKTNRFLFIKYLIGISKIFDRMLEATTSQMGRPQNRKDGDRGVLGFKGQPWLGPGNTRGNKVEGHMHSAHWTVRSSTSGVLAQDESKAGRGHVMGRTEARLREIASDRSLTVEKGRLGSDQGPQEVCST